MFTRPILLSGAIAMLALPSGAVAAPKDSDHDGMPNRWELRYHLNPKKKSDAGKDKDRDGLSNLAEYQARTNPRKADSNGDGTPDGAEDADGDGVENEVEDRTGSNPGQRDSDHDGVEDGDELAGTVVSFDGTTLVIAAVDGTQRSGVVTAETEIEGCPVEPAASAARDRRDEHEDDEDAPESSPEHAGTSEGGDDAEPTACVAALVAGTPVREAEIEHGAFHSVHLNGDRRR